MERVCNPVLGDRNNSLLHHLARHSVKKLHHIFSKTPIEDRFSVEDMRLSFFFNFDKKSPLDIAIESFDLESF